MEQHVNIALLIRPRTLHNNPWREQEYIKGSNHKKLISKLLRKQASA